MLQVARIQLQVQAALHLARVSLADAAREAADRALEELNSQLMDISKVGSYSLVLQNTFLEVVFEL